MEIHFTMATTVTATATATTAAISKSDIKMSKSEKEKQTIPPSECMVCAQPYTKYRQHVFCPNPECNYECCSQCIQNYIITKVGDPGCMNCGIAWNRDFLYTNLTKSFMNVTLKTHRRDALFELEKTRFPESMNDIANYNTIKKEIDEYSTTGEKKMKAEQLRVKENIQTIIKPYNNKIKALEEEIYKLQNEKKESKKPLILELRKIEKDSRELHDKYWRQKRLINNYEWGNFSEGPSKFEKRAFVHPCSVEGCRGFLSTSWKCGVCDHYSCKDCFETIGKNKHVPHTCKKENVESANLIKKETKPCPKCGCRIYKISGCDQMWCTSCHVTFSWKTGALIKGIVHNPHFYEFQRAGGNAAPRNPGDQVCGGLPNYNILEDVFTRIKKCIKFSNIFNKWYTASEDIVRKIDFSEKPKNLDKMINLCRRLHESTAHNIDNIVDPLRRKIQNETDNRDLRFNYLLNKIDEKNFKRQLSMRDTKRYKNQTLLDVVELYNTVCIELLQNVSSININKLEATQNIYKNDFTGMVKNHNIDAIDLLYELVDESEKIINNYIYKIYKVYETMPNLIKYVNEEFKKHSKQLNVTTYRVDAEYQVIRHKWE